MWFIQYLKKIVFDPHWDGAEEKATNCVLIIIRNGIELLLNNNAFA